MNTSQITAALAGLLPLVAMLAVSLATLKAFGVVLPVKGSVETWAWVAVACAAAKLSR